MGEVDPPDRCVLPEAESRSVWTHEPNPNASFATFLGAIDHKLGVSERFRCEGARSRNEGCEGAAQRALRRGKQSAEGNPEGKPGQPAPPRPC